MYLTQPATGLNVPIFSGHDDNVFSWTVGKTTESGVVIAPGAGYQLALFDATASGDRVLNATSPAFNIYVVQPSITINSIFEGACVRRGVACTRLSSLNREPPPPTHSQQHTRICL